MAAHSPTDPGPRPASQPRRPASQPRVGHVRGWLPRLGLGVAVAAALAAALAGCGGASPPQAVLQTQPGFHPGSAAPTCLLHQTEQPSGAYQAGPGQQPEPELTFLAYYTATGNQPFCDGQPPTPLDRSWAQLYAQLTGDTTAVGRLLG